MRDSASTQGILEEKEENMRGGKGRQFYQERQRGAPSKEKRLCPPS